MNRDCIATVEVRRLSGPDFDAIRSDFEFAGRAFDRSLLVSGTQQVGGEIVRLHRLAGEKMPWRGVHTRSVLVNLAGQPLVDELAKLDVVVSEDRRCEHQQKQNGAQDRQSNFRRPKPWGQSNSQTFTPGSRVSPGWLDAGRAATSDAWTPQREALPLLQLYRNVGLQCVAVCCDVAVHVEVIDLQIDRHDVMHRDRHGRRRGNDR